jgi:DNA polymerase
VLAGGTTVFCVLPCGRRLTYPDVRLETRESAYGVKTEITYLRANWMPKADEREWPRAKTYGGSLAENATQAAAASLMRWALRRLDAAGAPVVASIHDQALVECPLDEQDHWHAVLHDAMNSAPDWAEGLPIEAEVDVRERFGK